MMLTLRGAQVYAEQHGHGKPDILLLHGWGCSTQLWAPITARLSQRARVTAIDFPGHGQSGRPPESWGAAEYAEMTAELIEALGIQGCDIIGHSHGGRIALRLAVDRPELVGRLVLTGAAGLKAELTEAQKKRSATYSRLRDMADALDRIKILGPLPERIREALRQKYGSADYKALDAEMRKTFVKLVQTNLIDELPKVQASTLLIWGDADTETPLWMGQKMEELIPDAGLVVLRGGSHFAYLEKQADFLRITEHFLLGGTP